MGLIKNIANKVSNLLNTNKSSSNSTKSTTKGSTGSNVAKSALPIANNAKSNNVATPTTIKLPSINSPIGTNIKDYAVSIGDLPKGTVGTTSGNASAKTVTVLPTTAPYSVNTTASTGSNTINKNAVSGNRAGVISSNTNTNANANTVGNVPTIDASLPIGNKATAQFGTIGANTNGLSGIKSSDYSIGKGDASANTSADATKNYYGSLAADAQRYADQIQGASGNQQRHNKKDDGDSDSSIANTVLGSDVGQQANTITEKSGTNPTQRVLEGVTDKILSLFGKNDTATTPIVPVANALNPFQNNNTLTDLNGNPVTMTTQEYLQAQNRVAKIGANPVLKNSPSILDPVTNVMVANPNYTGSTPNPTAVSLGQTTSQTVQQEPEQKQPSKQPTSTNDKDIVDYTIPEPDAEPEQDQQQQTQGITFGGSNYSTSDLVNNIVNALTGDNSEVIKPDVLSYAEAYAQALQNLGGQYDTSLQKSLNEMRDKALQSGFYGQANYDMMVAKALQSGELEKNSAISQLATTLVGQSREEAQDTINNWLQNKKINVDGLYNLLQLIYKYNNTTSETKTDSDGKKSYYTTKTTLN